MRVGPLLADLPRRIRQVPTQSGRSLARLPDVREVPETPGGRRVDWLGLQFRHVYLSSIPMTRPVIQAPHDRSSVVPLEDDADSVEIPIFRQTIDLSREVELVAEMIVLGHLGAERP